MTDGFTLVAGEAGASNDRDTRMSALDYRVDPAKLNTLEDVVEFIGLAGFFMSSEDPNFKDCKKFLETTSIQEQLQNA